MSIEVSDAWKEAIASVDPDAIMLWTVELHHSTFLDDLDQQIAIRVVDNVDDMNFTLDDDAPLDPGDSVLFKACPFSWDGPDLDEDGTPFITVKLDNIEGELSKYLPQVIQTLEPVVAILRGYFADSPETLETEPVYYDMRDFTQQAGAVTVKAYAKSLSSRPIPTLTYTPDKHPSLAEAL